MAIEIGLDSSVPPGPGNVVFDAGIGQILSNINETLAIQAAAIADITAHALTVNPDGTYDTNNVTLNVSDASTVTGNVTIGSVGANAQLARGNFNVQLTGASPSLTFQSTSYVGPQSSLNVSQSVPNGVFVNNGTETIQGGGANFATNVAGSGLFNLEAYLSDPANTSSAILTFQGSVTGQDVQVGTGCQLNLGQPLAFRNGAIGEDPGSQVVLRGTQATSFTYQNGVLSVVNNGVQVADLQITPTHGANGFTVTQIGPDAVISAVALNAQQLANAAMPTPVLQG